MALKHCMSLEICRYPQNPSWLQASKELCQGVRLAVVELGERLGVPMPSTRAVYACAKLLDEHQGQRVLAKVEGVGS